MKKKSFHWLDFIGDVVAANPKMSALIAFELGHLAGRATNNAADNYKALKPKIGEARDYIKSHIPSLPGASPQSSLALLRSPTLQPKKRTAAAGRKKPRKKTTAA